MSATSQNQVYIFKAKSNSKPVPHVSKERMDAARASVKKLRQDQKKA